MGLNVNNSILTGWVANTTIPEEGFVQRIQQEHESLFVNDHSLGAKNFAYAGRSEKGKVTHTNKFDELGNAQQVLNSNRSKILPARARRKLKRLVNFAAKAVSAFAVIPQKLHEETFLSKIDAKTVCCIVDSGTAYHIVRDEECFASIDSGKTVNIRSATGLDSGRRGVLKDSFLGSGIRAIHYPLLPVAVLLSTDGLKQHGWETHLTLPQNGGDYLLHPSTMTFYQLTRKDNLPTIEIDFGNTPAFVVSCNEKPKETVKTPKWFKANNVEINNSNNNNDNNSSDINEHPFGPDRLNETLYGPAQSQGNPPPSYDTPARENPPPTSKCEAQEHSVDNTPSREHPTPTSKCESQVPSVDEEMCVEVGPKETDLLPPGTTLVPPPTLRKRARSNCSGKRKLVTSKIVPNKLRLHQRLGHFYDASSRIECIDCLQFKGRKTGHEKVRNQKFDTPSPFLLTSTDFFGKIKPTSYRLKKWVMLFIDDHSGFAYAQCLKTKSEAPRVLEEFVTQVRRKIGVPYGKTTHPQTNKLIIAGIRSDNEPVLRSREWENTCNRLCVQQTHSVPYEPQGNGTCERFVQSTKDSLRVSMGNVDPRLWDYCIDNLIQLWNMRPSLKATLALGGSKRKINKTPNDVLRHESMNPLVKARTNDREEYTRRFGCLAYFKPYLPNKRMGDYTKDSNSPLLPKRIRGVYLGLSPTNSSWLIGIYRNSELAVYETRSAIFLEDVMVNDVEELAREDPPVLQQILTRLNALDKKRVSAGEQTKVAAGEYEEYSLKGLEVSQYPDGGDAQTQISKDPLESLRLPHRHNLSEQVNGENSKKVVELDLGESQDEGVRSDQEPVNSKVLAPKSLRTHEMPVGTLVSGENSNTKSKTDRMDKVLGSDLPRPDQGVEVSGATSSATRGNAQGETGAQQSSSGDYTYGPPTVVNKRRGRPKGSKDKKAGKRKRKTKEEMRKEKEATQEKCNFLTDEEFQVYSHLAFDPEEEHEEIEEVQIFLVKDPTVPSKPGDSVSPTTAFNPVNVERPKWVEAKSLEQARLEAYKCWRKLSPEEEVQWRQGKLQAIPCALLLNRKRCGRFKARLVVLGNRWKPNAEDNSVYASVVSQVGNRATMVQIAKNGFIPKPFDISNAFIRASMGDTKVCVKLPESFREEGNKADDGKRMLLKALYGLPISPRLWAKTLAADLTKLGWIECLHEPGVWHRRCPNTNLVTAFLTVYVDDCVLACRNMEETNAELKKIHDKHPLSEIETHIDAKGTRSFDMTGVDVSINPNSHTLKMSMSNYTKKVLKRFDIPLESTKSLTTPSFPEANLYTTNSAPSKFPFRECVGALQWLATNTRPDIAHSTNMLARASCNPVTTSMAKCCRIVLKYLVGTIDTSIEYSPASEKAFEKLYTEVSKHPDNAKVETDQMKNAVTTFTDASFGVTYKEMRSISGVIIYLYGTPIAWSSKIQSAFAKSTTESEWIAMADGISLSQSVYQVHQFLMGRPTKQAPLFGDNRGAVLSAREKDITDIAKKTRHIALRFQAVREEKNRVWFCPTDLMKADGLTKSSNAAALKMIFDHSKAEKKKFVVDAEENNECEFTASEADSWVSTYFNSIGRTMTLDGTWSEGHTHYCLMSNILENY
ncbi:MAG: hypothetical protein CMH98_16415 [Oceanospirillaceae bacterium]|nr:hypothetical protein [Oceanospirillaceae bacterium]